MNTAGRSQAFVGLEVRPFKPLQAETVYTATVKRVQSASGIPMIGEYTWQFRTENSQAVQNVMAVGTSYYYFGSQRVALRISGDPDPERNGLFYIHTDHLGSTSLLSYGQGHEDAGEEVPGSRAAHLPFGEYWQEPDAGLSDRGFTGHRALEGLGLVHMRARVYVVGIGRFVQPDSIDPDLLGPQGLDRYSYVQNRPLNFRDPTGHVVECSSLGGGCDGLGLSELWDPAYEKSVSPHSRLAAERAFAHFLEDPEFFVNLYQDPEAWYNSDEVAALDVFMQYSILHSTAEDLILTGYVEGTDLNNLCTPGSLIAVGMFVLLLPIDTFYLYAQWLVYTRVPYPGNVVAEVFLMPVDLAMIELHAIVAQLAVEGVQKPCEEVHVDPLPPWGFDE
jgi:RHS repeat-associated protein